MPSMPILFTAISALTIPLCDCSTLNGRDINRGDLDAAFHELQKWYRQDAGTWDTATWWQNANCLTMLANLAGVEQTRKQEVSSVADNTYARAPVEHADFLNDYYDDEGWWGLAWVATYDMTGNKAYLSQAEAIFADMKIVFGRTNCSTNDRGTGGIFWDKAHSYVNAIANELFLALGASLANRVSSGDYPETTRQQWDWLQGTGLLNEQNLINDGLDANCQNNGRGTWTYNQGVILGAAVELSKATGDSSYLSSAQSIADAAIASLAPNGILREPCEVTRDCNQDRSQFKGIFTRNLQYLQQATGQSRYAEFLKRNAESI